MPYKYKVYQTDLNLKIVFPKKVFPATFMIHRSGNLVWRFEIIQTNNIVGDVCVRVSGTALLSMDAHFI